MWFNKKEVKEVKEEVPWIDEEYDYIVEWHHFGSEEDGYKLDAGTMPVRELKVKGDEKVKYYYGKDLKKELDSFDVNEFNIVLRDQAERYGTPTIERQMMQVLKELNKSIDKMNNKLDILIKGD